jgi:CO/xanthine dehydrogenase Mo-binding subunit
MNQIGIDIPKVDVLEKVLGSAQYGADRAIENPFYLKVVRSGKAHAGVAGIQYAEALNVPGVERIFTAKDIPGKNLLGIITKDQPVLASDRVRYIGDPVALVDRKSVV